ncbi:hypothetical protein AB7008_48125 [Bradyrhizobium sp. 521_C7_N1_3]|uniref:hypothetical protein n=1 Tax=Bradyrhizobium sp. 521_C7_N1_3 TaxID=3240368 RepID=UPI003F8ADCD5
MEWQDAVSIAGWAFIGLIVFDHFVVEDPRKSSDVAASIMRTVIMMGVALALVYTWSGRKDIKFWNLAEVSVLYGLGLFVLLSDALRHGLGAKLTRWRGSNWVKELDYVYLCLGGVGALTSLNRLETVSDKLGVSDIYGPIILTTALVIRAIKTRSEINKWNEA